MMHGMSLKRKLRFISGKRILVAAVCAVVLVILLSFAGRALVVDDARPSDVAIVLSGDVADSRLQAGLNLLRMGYTHELILDESTGIMFGRTFTEYAQDYVQTLPPDVRKHVHVCSYSGDSTKAELVGVWQCAITAAPGTSKVLLVTSEYHSRRARSIAERILPQYSWSVSATRDPTFGVHWWRHREWAKTCLTEWQKLLWWELIERWRA